MKSREVQKKKRENLARDVDGRAFDLACVGGDRSCGFSFGETAKKRTGGIGFVYREDPRLGAELIGDA